jgi:hypothetical protein
MPARVPQDVDLEDKLIYGLSPLRFGYLVMAVLGAVGLWRVAALPVWLRAIVCLLLTGGGAALAWGRWHGRPVDRWLVDAAVFVRRNRWFGIAWRPRLPSRRRRPPALEAHEPAIVRLAAINTLRGRPGPDASERRPAA